MQQIGKMLYGEPKNGKIKVWKVFVEGADVIVEWGRLGGKQQQKRHTCEAKNVGRSNETSPEEQAVSEAKALWTKHYDNKLYRETPEEAAKVGELLPMLAVDGRKDPDAVKLPALYGDKLDGVRGTVYRDDEGNLKAISRQGKFYNIHGMLYAQLNAMMLDLDIDKVDGEFYKHGYKLQEIVSMVRNTDNPKHEEIEFHIFDVPVADTPMLERYENLLDIEEYTKEHDLQLIPIVPCFVVDTWDEIDKFVEDSESRGYEGGIIRNLQGKYEFNHRSKDLIKVKNMKDSEAKVVGKEEDAKSAEGKLIAEWHTEEGVKLIKFKMRGTHEERKYENLDKWFGKWVNFRYQALTKDGQPQFAVGICERECDDQGNPLY